VFALIEQNARGLVPDLFLDCGVEDEFLEINRECDEVLKVRSVGHRYREIAGGHDWDYWAARLTEVLVTADGYLS
jgi:putative tributyrin esterase